MIVKNEELDHFRKDIVYPASKKEIVEACNQMSDVSAEDKEWFEKNMPEWSFRNADLVIQTIQVVDSLSRVSFPISRKDLSREFDRMSIISKSSREWFRNSLLDKNYSNIGDVLGTLQGIMHIRDHVTYPTTKRTILETCKGMLEVPSLDRDYIERCLPEKNFNSADDVIKSCRL